MSEMTDIEARLAEATRILEWMLKDFKMYSESDDEKKMADRYAAVIDRVMPLVKDGEAK